MPSESTSSDTTRPSTCSRTIRGVGATSLRTMACTTFRSSSAQTFHDPGLQQLNQHRHRRLPPRSHCGLGERTADATDAAANIRRALRCGRLGDRDQRVEIAAGEDARDREVDSVRYGASASMTSCLPEAATPTAPSGTSIAAKCAASIRR